MNEHVLRGLLGLLIKKRTADADLLEIRKENVDDFLSRYTIGIADDVVGGVYVIHVAPKEKSYVETV